MRINVGRVSQSSLSVMVNVCAVPVERNYMFTLFAAVF
jgi:hypothetical protein